MTPARFLVIVLLIIGGLFTFFIVRKLWATEEVQEPPRRTVQVPMAIGDLEAGTIITESHLGRANVFADKIERDTILNQRSLLGRVVREDIKKATQINVSQLYPVGVFPPLDVEEGMQAVSVAVGDNTAIVNGLIAPDERVDVHLTPNRVSDEDSGGALSVRILEGARVIAINRGFANGSASRSNNIVTLELTPKQVQAVNLAQSQGSLMLSHNPNWKGAPQLTTDRFTLRELLAIPEPEEEEEEEERDRYTTAIYRRSGFGLNAFDKENGDPLGYSARSSFNNFRFNATDLTTDATGQSPRGAYRNGASNYFTQPSPNMTPAPRMAPTPMNTPVPMSPVPMSPAPSLLAPPGSPMGPTFN